MQATLVSQIFLPFALFIIMLSVGMSLRLTDFLRVARQPVPVFLGILTQLLMLPVLGWIVVQLFALPPLLAAGLMILTFAPGGATSNAITLLARGDTALSVSLTAVNSLIIPFTLPLFTALMLAWLSLETTLIRFPVAQAIGQMVMITLLPAVLGMLFSHYCAQLSCKVQSLFRSLAMILMLMAVILLVVSSWDRLIVLLPQLALPVLVLVLAAMSLGYILARLVGLGEPQQVTLLVEVGLQNAGTALLVTSTLLQSPEMSASALVYGVLMQVPALLLIVWRNRVWLFDLLKRAAVSG